MLFLFFTFKFFLASLALGFHCRALFLLFLLYPLALLLTLCSAALTAYLSAVSDNCGNVTGSKSEKEYEKQNGKHHGKYYRAYVSEAKTADAANVSAYHSAAVKIYSGSVEGLYSRLKLERFVYCHIKHVDKGGYCNLSYECVKALGKKAVFLNRACPSNSHKAKQYGHKKRAKTKQTAKHVAYSLTHYSHTVLGADVGKHSQYKAYKDKNR